MVFAFVFQTQLFQHLHHSIHSIFRPHYFDEIVFDIDVFLEVTAKFQRFRSSLQSQTSADIPISTGHKTKVPFLQELFAFEPFVEIDQSFLNSYTFINLILSYSSQLCTEFSELWIKSRLYILMECIYLFVLVSINQNDRKFNDLRTGIDFVVFYTSSLKIKYKQIFYLRFVIISWQIESNIAYLCFRECCSIFFRKFNTDIADVGHIINTTMMLALVFQIQDLKHVHHTAYFLQSHYFRTVFFYVDVTPKIFPNIKFFVFGLVFKTIIQIPISTCDNRVVTFFQIFEFIEPFVQLFECLLNRNALVDHFLCDSCKLGAEWCKLRIKCRFDILMKNIQLFASRQMHNNDWELDDL